VAVAVLVWLAPELTARLYEQVAEAFAGTFTVVLPLPQSTVAAPELESASVTETPLAALGESLVIVIVPVTLQALSAEVAFTVTVYG
jgi:hypothetical protein